MTPPASQEKTLLLGDAVPDAKNGWENDLSALAFSPAPASPKPAQKPVDIKAPSILTEESSAVGGERHGEPQPAISFGMDDDAPKAQAVQPAAVPAPEPVAAPMAPEPPPPARAPERPPEERKTASPEAGGTTVLIRYTCPKCKTQGMQAVDKVGTVVNCSNCGKAMRLVMKK